MQQDKKKGLQTSAGETENGKGVGLVRREDETWEGQTPLKSFDFTVVFDTFKDSLLINLYHSLKLCP